MFIKIRRRKRQLEEQIERQRFEELDKLNGHWLHYHGKAMSLSQQLMRLKTMKGC